MSEAAEMQSDTAASKHNICLSWPGGRRNISVGPEATLQDIETQAKYVSNSDKIILKSGFPPRRLVIDKATNAREALPAQTLVVVELDDSGGTTRSSGGTTRSSGGTTRSVGVTSIIQDKTSRDDNGGDTSRGSGGKMSSNQDKISRSGGDMSRGSGGDTSRTRDKKTRKRSLSMTSEMLGESWTCDACTFLNRNEATICEICDRQDKASGPAEGDCTAYTPLNEPDTFICNAPGKARVECNADHGLVVSDKNKGPPLSLPSTITVISFNVAGFEPSVSAPAGFDSITAFSSEILQHQPDIICLQEVPSGITHVFRGYLSLGSAPSHCENVVLLVKDEWARHAIRVVVDGPAVMCKINFSNRNGVEQSIVFGSCHLAPFKELASTRMDQTRSVVRVVPDNLPFILAGDFNMRTNEDKNVENLGFLDAWKEAGMDFSQKFTWDSIDRTNEGGSYNCFHADCYQFNCRFDRVYFKQGTNDMFSVKHFNLIGNRPLTNNKHYLSDHFGMMTTFDIRE